MEREFDTLLKGIELVQIGRSRHAGRLFVDLLREEPENEQAWWWLAACVESDQQKRECLERLLHLNPTHQDALAALRQMDTPADCPLPPHNGGLDLLKMSTRIVTKPLKSSAKGAEQHAESLDAARAYEAEENFDAAYDCYLKLLEIDNQNAEAWLGRGFAAGMTSSAYQNRVREFFTCLQRGILMREPHTTGTLPRPDTGSLAAVAAARMEPALQRIFLDRLLRLIDYISLLAGRCAPAMANIYLVELAELADWAFHFSQPLSVREGRLCTRADLLNMITDLYQRIAVNVINTTRGPRARRELLDNFQSLITANLRLSGLNDDPDLRAHLEEIDQQACAG